MSSKENQRLERKNEFSDSNLKALKKKEIIAHFTAVQTKYNILEIKSLNQEIKIKIQR